MLDNSIADINRLKQMGQIDVCISYEPIYNGKRKVGNPAFIEFTVYDTIEQMRQALVRKQQTQHLTSLFAEAAEVNPGESEWQQLVAMLDGDIVSELRKVAFVSYDGNTILIKATNEQRQRIEDCLTDAVIPRIRDLLKRAFGRPVT